MHHTGLEDRLQRELDSLVRENRDVFNNPLSVFSDAGADRAFRFNQRILVLQRYGPLVPRGHAQSALKPGPSLPPHAKGAADSGEEGIMTRRSKATGC